MLTLNCLLKVYSHLLDSKGKNKDDNKSRVCIAQLVYVCANNFKVSSSNPLTSNCTKD